MTKYSLSNFKDEMKDIARPYHYRVEFQGGSFANLSGKEIVHIRTSVVPGITTNEVPLGFYGETFKMAGTHTFNNINVEFLIDAEYSIAKELYKSLSNVASVTKDGEGLWKAPADYQGDMKLIYLNTSKAPAHDITLKMAYVSSVADVALGQETKDTPLLFSATITYSYFEN